MIMTFALRRPASDQSLLAWHRAKWRSAMATSQSVVASADEVAAAHLARRTYVAVLVAIMRGSDRTLPKPKPRPRPRPPRPRQ